MADQIKPGVWARFAPDGPRKEQHRHTFRLPGYDYSQVGAYYVTLCTQNRECLFGEIIDGVVALNPLGRIVQEEWQQTAAIRAEIMLDAFVVMPNHLHAVLIIAPPASATIDAVAVSPPDPAVSPPDPVGAHGVRPVFPAEEGVGWEEGARRAPLHRRPRSLGAIIAGFKSAATRRINAERDTPGWCVWQRNYHERIIRNDDNLHRARLYIANNPMRWQDDVNNPVNLMAVNDAPPPPP